MEARLDPGQDATGGNFSCGYHVSRSDGTKAFLKALDFSRALGAPDPARALQSLTEAFNYERNLLAVCTNRRMDRVVQVVTDGKVKVDESPLGTVQYLILECGDRDLRAQLAAFGNVETAWKLRSLHHIATGLKQLHDSGIAHQDLKPSNVVVFAGAMSKVSDLGAASLRGTVGPRDGFPFAGDPAYAPPEGLYGYANPEWSWRRLGCDAYLLGSMMVYFFTGLSITSLIFDQMRDGHHWRKWAGSYSDVLPYVRYAFGQSMDIFGRQIPDQALAQQLRVLLSQLCDPDPSLRGHPLNRRALSNPLSLERYVSEFDLLARRAEFAIR